MVSSAGSGTPAASVPAAPCPQAVPSPRAMDAQAHSRVHAGRDGGGHSPSGAANGSPWRAGGGTPATGEGVQSQGQDTCSGMGTGNMHSPWLLPATLYDCPGGSRGREVQAEPTTQAQGTSPTAATYSRGAGRQQGSGQVGKGARRERGDTVTTSGICSPATHVSKQREYKPSRAMNHPRLPHPQPPGCISTCSSHPGWAMLFLQGSVCNCKSPSAALYMGCSDSWCHPHPLCHPPVSSVPLPRMPHG